MQEDLLTHPIALLRILGADENGTHRRSENFVGCLAPSIPVHDGPGDRRCRVVEHKSEGSPRGPVLAPPEQLRRVPQELGLIGLALPYVSQSVSRPGYVTLHTPCLEAVGSGESIPVRLLSLGPELFQRLRVRQRLSPVLGWQPREARKNLYDTLQVPEPAVVPAEVQVVRSQRMARRLDNRSGGIHVFYGPPDRGVQHAPL